MSASRASRTTNSAAGAARGGDLRINIGHGQGSGAVGSGGLLKRGLGLKRPDAAQKRARGFHRRGRNAQQHGHWLAFGGDDQVSLASRLQPLAGRFLL